MSTSLSLVGDNDNENDKGKLVTLLNGTEIHGQKDTADEETLEMLRHIGILQTIISSQSTNRGMVDSSDGMLYLSRFAFGAEFMERKKSNIQMSMKQG